ncbi:hypothetical protein RPHASCH2410_CH15375 [Rhizobium phaseoli Ch24-10]|nr:hypothetical protein RPHASCH2410_CH15375 [Rhizobium phaseoli Ch24-10]
MGNYNPPLISCDNIKIKRNHSYALCKQSYQRTRHPPRRVLSFLRDGLPQGDRYDRCIGKRSAAPTAISPVAMALRKTCISASNDRARAQRQVLPLGAEITRQQCAPIEIMSLL